MPTIHTVTIEKNLTEKPIYVPEDLQIEAGDSVVWENSDDESHTADGSQFEFSTGDIAPGTSSEPIEFPDPSGHSGISYICTYHPHMNGRIVIVDGTNDTVSLTQDSQSGGYTIDDWRLIRRHLLEFWVYDMADDFEHAIANSDEATRAQLLTHWTPILELWRNELNQQNAALADRSVLNSASDGLLMSIGRRLRAAVRLNLTAVQRHPNPNAQGQVGSNAFGKAITVFKHPAGHPVRSAFNLETAYIGAAFRIELGMDLGVQVPDSQFDDYRASKAAISVDDYAILAQHQVEGLQALFGKDEYDDTQFATGIWSMTFAGEWESPFYVGWHWLKWVDAYIGTLELGQVPDIIEVPSA